MAKISLAGFKDPVRRPRYIIWAAVAVLVIIAVMIPVLGVTSTRWFCSEGCHKVQDDTIIAYQHSSHSNISCMACHMPVNANPVVFMLHKAEALGELYMTVTNKFELPLNGESEVALTMTPDKCTQCHNLATRPVTPSAGMKINHDKHTEKEIACTICHNRIAHTEDFTPTLKDPNTGEPNHPHTNFMSMDSCFRCHDQEAGAAPGACILCHTTGFELKPDSHVAGDFMKKHGEMAKEALAEVEEVEKEFGIEKVTPEVKMEWSKTEEGEKAHEPLGEKLIPTGAVFYCGTCHKQDFCTNCHGTQMPHSETFVEPKDVKDPAGHPAQSKLIAKKCVMCHGDNAKTHFCDECHHGTKVGHEYDVKKPWVNQHPAAVAESGVKACTEKCHSPKFCVDCHSSKRVFPSSHRQGTWTHPATPAKSVYGKSAAEAKAKHALAAKDSIESCEVCHGAGGLQAKFCKSCHKLTLPHTDEFKKFHGATGRKKPSVCKNCHGFKEMCSNCHHIGSSNRTPWIRVHGSSVAKNGPETCIEKCHKKADCQNCHTRRKVVPASHKSSKFVKRSGKTLGNHAALYKKDSSICTFCHKGAEDTLPNSKFCRGCHGVSIPHAIDESSEQKYEHKAGFQKKKLKRSTCARCHETKFCNDCHHPDGAKSTKVWVHYHPAVVKKNGASPCFESCHQETFCSDCHVNRASRL
ncbi:MAG: hypothetical protein HGB10_10450 [Coriobacteriia bacterium]|nr:hypothetical protein [Coriobacteriia bacterium]